MCKCTPRTRSAVHPPSQSKSQFLKQFLLGGLDLEVYLDEIWGRRLKKGRQLFWQEIVHPLRQNPGYAYGGSEFRATGPACEKARSLSCQPVAAGVASHWWKTNVVFRLCCAFVSSHLCHHHHHHLTCTLHVRAYCLCLIAVCSAVGDGCPTLSSDVDTSRQTVEYFIQGGVFFANTRCRPGFTFSDLYSSASLIRCSHSAWTSRLTSCIGRNSTFYRSAWNADAV